MFSVCSSCRGSKQHYNVLLAAKLLPSVVVVYLIVSLFLHLLRPFIYYYHYYWSNYRFRHNSCLFVLMCLCMCVSPLFFFFFAFSALAIYCHHYRRLGVYSLCQHVCKKPSGHLPACAMLAANILPIEKLICRLRNWRKQGNFTQSS